MAGTANLSERARAWLAQGRRIDLLGRKVFVYERGAGPAILLLHGFPTSCYDWRGVIAALEGRFRCVAIDFPGFGLSDKPEAYSYSLFQQADHVEALAAALGLAEAHVVSHDMGTSVHCELLARERRGDLGFKIRASTITNGSMLQWLASITPFQKMLASNETLPHAMEICGRGLPGHFSALRSLMKRPQAWTDDDGETIDELMRFQDGHLRIPALAGYMRERYVHRDRWLGGLNGGQDRMQFVWADGDPIAVIAMGRELHSLYPRAGFHILGGLGHFLIVEAPAAVADRIAAFDA